MVDAKALKGTVHGDLDCTSCHTQLSEHKADQPHAAKLGPPSCQDCHEDASKAFGESIHFQKAKAGKAGTATCWSCHGVHDIYKSTDSRSMVFKANLPRTCASCHQKPHSGTRNQRSVSHYPESLHGRALANGHLNAPSCSDCHDSHAIFERQDPRAWIHPTKEPATCGKCHGTVARIYARSVHGRLLWPDGVFPADQVRPKETEDATPAGSPQGEPDANSQAKVTGGRRGPVCSDCHTAHEVESPSGQAFRLQSDERCGNCHKDRLKRYRETYHGKAMALGLSLVAACYDCHGHHDVMPHGDPRSKLSKERKLETCQKCHPSATQKFTEYLAHADHWDRKNYPVLFYITVVMTGLLLSVFAFFFLHTILWMYRQTRNYLRDPKAFRAQKQRTRELKKVYVRFRPVDRFCHILLFTSVLVLVTTGMPLKFYWTGWARWVFDVLGGPAAAATLHRIAAVILMVAFAIHIYSLVSLIWSRRAQFVGENGRFELRRFMAFLFGPDSLVPGWQDVKDLTAHMRYFMGLGPRPAFDRWTYWEKFDYMAVFWGVAVIGLSGLVLWIPETVTRWLPGWSINVALVVHSDEALLAAGFLFTFHFFHSHLRSEKFPMDHVIFSGRVSEEELKHERGRLYDRLRAEGTLVEDPTGGAEWNDWKSILVPIGMLAFVTGLLLAGAIYFSLVSRLF